ncbi:MAG: hypothetical protein D6762_01235 [Candidatus Neomarinimicrobiota bacterium]|nr:MAG: hypothetical protein D6762_01235 [Candidatus Neomarinimicrobiota bacterium]
MVDSSDPRQLPLFPELSEHPQLPSITTLPEFDHALNNLIKISDMGAFIQLNIQGFNKRFSLHFAELNIPGDFLNPEAAGEQLVTFQLFPDEIRRQQKKMAYEVKSFFTSKNSFRTPFGYFLFRSHFTLWKHYLEETRKSIDKKLYQLLGQGQYGRLLQQSLRDGLDYLRQFASDLAPWTFEEDLTVPRLEAIRHQLRQDNRSIASLRPTEVTYPRDLIVLKTLHFPLHLSDYVEQIQITSIFKTIHLEYLVDKEIKTLEDVQKLVEEM